MYKRIVLVLLFLAELSLFLYSQDDSIETIQQQSLYEQTLYNDINTASYYEILSWCRELELDDKGNIDSLKSLLYKHYGIELIAGNTTDSPASSIVKIVSADSTEYYTIDEVDEEYVRISGRVKLIIKQNSRDITHTIEADSIVFNKTTDTMTASGNVVYLSDENGNLEEYTGDNFTFNVKNWKGVILRGDFRKTQEVNDQEIEFIFSGESIQKGEDDVIVLNDGSISSCDAEDKHYQIKAKKIWILGPDEWAIISGFLYIGNVPVLYIPFYHLPGNDMFFNPAIGASTREGYFIQTTTYLLGEKDISEADDSFFINVADSDESYDLVREGLFLFKEPGGIEESSSDYAKYKLDYYSRLGGYTGLEGDVARLGVLKNIDFDIGLAVTKSISDDNDYYTNYFESNDYESEWNSSYLFGLTLPFRYGLTFDFSFSTFDVSFEYLSDPWFSSDFDDRDENFDWLNYLLAQTTEEEDVDTSSTSSLDWTLSGTVSIPNEWADDYVETFTFSSIKVNVDWSSKDNEAIDSDYDPGREFYYPDSITMPQTTMKLAGTLFEFSTNRSDSGKEKISTEKGALRSPWISGESSNEVRTGEGENDFFREPGNLTDIEIDDDIEMFSTKIDYSLSGYFNYLTDMNSDNWDEPADIGYDIDQSTLTNNNTLKLNYDADYLDSIFSFSGTNSLVTNYMKYFEDVDSDEATKEKANQKIDWSNDLNFKISPLKRVSYFNQSYVSYDLDMTLFLKEYDSTSGDFDDSWFTWDEDYVSTHKASANLDFTNSFFTGSVLFDTTIPPVDIQQSINPDLSATFFNWTNSVSVSAVYSDKEWTVEPLNFSSIYKPIENITVSEILKYSFEDGTLSSSVSTLKLWNFTTSFNMAYTTDYEWDKGNEELIDNGDAFVPSSFSLAYDLDYETSNFWKNRVNMGFSVDTSLDMDLQQYNLSELDFDFTYKIFISEFLNLNLTLSTTNDHMYLYFPSIRDYYGIEEDYNFFTDLLKSFNIFSEDQNDRYESFFNMNYIQVEMIHKMHDWDLELSYKGIPQINSDTYETTWDSTLTILIRWNPIEKIKAEVDYDDDEWNVDTDFE